MRHIISLILCLLATLNASAAYTVDNLPNVQKNDHTRHLVNPDGIISPAAAAQLDTLLADIRRQSTCEVVVVVVNDVDDDDLDNFATELFEKWKIGKSDRDNGLLWVVAKDRRHAVTRTGYGMEGVLPDGKIGTMMRQSVFPQFKANNYEQGVIAGVKQFHQVLTDPKNIAELRSGQRDKRSDITLFDVWVVCSIVVAGVCLLWFIVTLCISLKDSIFERYKRLNKLKMPLLFCSFFGLGMPLIAFLPLWFTLKRLRNKPRICSNCGTTMTKLDEVTDNQYLTATQDAEERIDSVDYDVWLCPNCNATQVLPYINKTRDYTNCPNCGARACVLESNTIITQPTSRTKGKGIRTYRCLHCHNKDERPYDIAKLASSPGIIPGGGHGFSGGGGGHFGGGFGGGSTGGGGFSGRW